MPALCPRRQRAGPTGRPSCSSWAFGHDCRILLAGFVFLGKGGQEARQRQERVRVGVSIGAYGASRFSIWNYLTAMLFIVFDIEIVFLDPLAVLLDQLALFGSSSSPRSWRARHRLHLIWRKGALDGSDPPGARSGLRATDIEGIVDDDDGRQVSTWLPPTRSGRSVRPGLLRDRDDRDALAALRHRPLRLRDHPATPRQSDLDRLGPRPHRMAAPIRSALRADARASRSWRSAPGRRPGACSRTTRSCRASTRSSPGHLRPGLRRAPRT